MSAGKMNASFCVRALKGFVDDVAVFAFLMRTFALFCFLLFS